MPAVPGGFPPPSRAVSSSRARASPSSIDKALASGGSVAAGFSGGGWRGSISASTFAWRPESSAMRASSPPSSRVLPNIATIASRPCLTLSVKPKILRFCLMPAPRRATASRSASRASGLRGAATGSGWPALVAAAADLASCDSAASNFLPTAFSNSALPIPARSAAGARVDQQSWHCGACSRRKDCSRTVSRSPSRLRSQMRRPGWRRPRTIRCVGVTQRGRSTTTQANLRCNS